VVRILDTATVDRYLTTEIALNAMRNCFRLEAEDRAGAAARSDLGHSAGWMRVLPAVFEGFGVFGHKVISFTSARGVRYVITLFDIETGEMRAVMDGEAITGARTGATSAVAADLLCRSAIGAMAILGTGSVARTQLPALTAVRPVEEIRVYSRNPANRAGFIAEMQPKLQAKLVDCPTPEDAIESADLITLATKSPEPVLGTRHLRPGIHVNSVGSARPNLSEIEPEAFAAFDLIVCDSVELVLGESGDALAAVSAGLFDVGGPVALSAALAARADRHPSDLTLFKSTGTGLQDLALAAAILEMAEAEDAGTTVDQVLAMKRFGATGRT
jgi:alanine dehydrogenase